MTRQNQNPPQSAETQKKVLPKGNQTKHTAASNNRLLAMPTLCYAAEQPGYEGRKNEMSDGVRR